jgi:pyruvate/2-oxoglutarate/acetoin dehydrogenase E1 component
MKKMTFSKAIESALEQAMADDKNVVIIGEDVHTLRVNLYTRYGADRVIPAPISESSFVGASVTAAMAGLRPVVEVMIIDFIGVAMDGVLNHASKVKDFSGNKWNVPMVIRSGCGGGYGDAGQHEQSLWGWLAHIPGISVVVPSTPADAGGLMLSAIESDDPVIYLEHKLLSEEWLKYLGSGGRETVSYDRPALGIEGEVPDKWEAIPLGKLKIFRDGKDITLISVGVGVHRCLEAAQILEKEGISAEVLDLRSVAPLDIDGIVSSVQKTQNVIVVDEDYKGFGLSGEISAILLENGISFQYGRVCTETTIPYSRKMEDEALPNTKRIIECCKKVLKK